MFRYLFYYVPLLFVKLLDGLKKEALYVIPTRYCCVDTESSLQAAVGCVVIKKFCKSEFLLDCFVNYLCNFLAMTLKPIHTTKPKTEHFTLFILCFISTFSD
ncbi:hypothetical protein FEC77_04930 [Rickettsia parkeri]|nr:hypothetical protein FEC77_04930 [Rickettsia parkeri]